MVQHFSGTESIIFMRANRRRNMFLCFALIFTALVGSAKNGAAQSCYQYYNDKSKLEADKRQFIWEYKGTVVALTACMAACKDQVESDKAGCYLTACGGACLFVGINNCVNFFTKNVDLDKIDTRLKEYGKRIGCEK